MNRSEEYQLLLKELEETPKTLDTTVDRAMKREKASRRAWRFLGIPATSLAACFIGFILLVNLFPPFAMACGSVPVLRELAKAVAWSASLSAAVENEYVQPIDQTQHENGLTATVHYVIVDRKKASFFYTLDYDKSLEGRVNVDYSFGDLSGWSGSAGDFGLESGDMREIDVEFVDRDTPGTVDLTLKVYATREVDGGLAEPEGNWKEQLFTLPEEESPVYAAVFTFHLTFDPYFTAQGEIIPVDTTFTLDGQMLTLTEVELYPTHLRVNLDDGADNTAWLKGLELYLENEHGDRFDSAVNGISASGDPDGRGFCTFWLDSPYFSQGEHLTLHITGAQWLNKEDNLVRLDLPRGTAQGLPEEFRFLKAERMSGGWLVSFAAPKAAGGGMYQLFDGMFQDESGVEYDILQNGNSYGYEDPISGEWVSDDTVFTVEFPLVGFEGDVVYLEPCFTEATELETPVSISIR